jgi:bacterioferritin (cytochrome b1)
MSAAPVAVIDALNALLEAELNSIFRFMGEGSPYLSRATAEIRRPLNGMVLEGQRHAAQLADMIDRLGGIPSPKSIQPEEQYLAFLTLKFLLPKLAEAKKLTIERYENTLRAFKDASSDVTELLGAHIAEHQADLKILEKVAADLLVKKA